MASISTIMLAKPKLTQLASIAPRVYEPIKQGLSPAQKYLKDLENKKKPAVRESISLKEKHKVLEITRKKGLSLNLKLLVASGNPRSRYITEECALVLEEILDSVSQNRSLVLESLNQRKNKAFNDKKELEELKEKEAMEKEKIRRMHHEILKKDLKEKEKNKEEKIKENDKEKELALKKEKLWKERIKENESLKNKINEYHRSKSEEREAKQKSEEAKKNKEKSIKDKEFIEFNKKEKNKMNEKFNQIYKERLEEKQALEKQANKEKEQWKEYNQKILPGKFKVQSKISKYEKGVNEQISILIRSASFQLFFSKYSWVLATLYDYISKRTFVPLNFAGQSFISLEGLSLFAGEFNICPTLLPLKEILLIYKSLTKQKVPEYIKDTVSKGLNYEEFLIFSESSYKGAQSLQSNR